MIDPYRDAINDNSCSPSPAGGTGTAQRASLGLSALFGFLGKVFSSGSGLLQANMCQLYYASSFHCQSLLLSA